MIPLVTASEKGLAQRKGSSPAGEARCYVNDWVFAERLHAPQVPLTRALAIVGASPIAVAGDNR